MNKQSDLLPWILGGLSMATVAVAITAASVGKTGAPTFRAASAMVVPLAPDAVSPSLPSAALAPTSNPATATAASDPSPAPPPATPMQTTEPPVQGGQIWECTTNGLKTFSNNPCGEKSSLIEVRAINTMNPTPVMRYASAYGAASRYSPQYADQNAYSDQDTYSDQGAADSAGNSYALVQGLAFLPRKRSEHPHQPPSHHSPGPSLRRN
jgi:hypothetical protein